MQTSSKLGSSHAAMITLVKNRSLGKVVCLQGEAGLQGAPNQWLCGPDQVVHHMQSLEAAPLLSLRCL